MIYDFLPKEDKYRYKIYLNSISVAKGVNTHIVGMPDLTMKMNSRATKESDFLLDCTLHR